MRANWSRCINVVARSEPLGIFGIVCNKTAMQAERFASATPIIGMRQKYLLEILRIVFRALILKSEKIVVSAPTMPKRAVFW